MLSGCVSALANGNTKISSLVFFPMIRLNHRAFEILCAEVQKCSSADLAGQVQRDIVLKRLKKLRSSSGEPATLEELRDTVRDVFPNFSEKALKSAAKANRPPGALSKIKWATGILVGAAGVLWVVNLPYPMIRWPIAQTAPILLLPSYISMDSHYRRAIARVEQADQLINHATSPTDLTLGESKVREAQENLDALPVWFLGYWPQYTFWFGWQFILDEFRSARASVGRMEAKLFQEKNAQTQLNQAQQALSAAKQQYQQGQTATDRETALASWQAALNQLEQVPQVTLAGQTAQTQRSGLKRDFEQVARLAAGGTHTGTLIEAAQQFALTAAQAAQNPPHTASEWSEIVGLWEQAINQLKQVPVEDPGYVEAQKFRAQYQRNLGIVRTRLQAEEASVEALKQAKDRIESLLTSFPTDATPLNRNQLNGQLQGIINQLSTVQPETTAYSEAQELLKSAQNKLLHLPSKNQ